MGIKVSGQHTHTWWLGVAIICGDSNKLRRMKVGLLGRVKESGFCCGSSLIWEGGRSGRGFLASKLRA